ncbi:MAG: DNA gyrase subunit A [Chlamydiae bacterium]|nr:MAG: DNA gyrase subunit A [Chlamydiota bacterium]
MEQIYTKNEKILSVSVIDEMKTSFIDYSMSVIISRALPEIRDGLKPVHRRILYAMFREGLLHNRKFTKCAGVVGEVLKKYHPHGDSAVYDTLVRMAQPWNMRYPLIEGQGNFGSLDGDKAAAYRYTESRMTELAEYMLADIDKNTVNFTPNFDESVMEPTVLPTKVPQLLLNGTAGIAVGMATNVPSHNLVELCDAIAMIIDNPECTLDELLEVIPGPDFATGGVICGTSEIKRLYETGRGKLRVRGKAGVEPTKQGKECIIITEIPYMVNKATLVTTIAKLVNEKKITGISDLRDESDKDGVRIVVEMKRGEIPEVVLNQLYKHTQLQTTFGGILLSIEDGQPKTNGLKVVLNRFIEHRKDVIIKRTRFDLEKAELRAHILEGFLKALDIIDKIIKLIRGSKNRDEANAGLIEQFKFTEIQAKAILDMRLYQLTGLEKEKLQDEYEEILKLIEYLNSILNNPGVLMGIILEELKTLKKRFGDERRSDIIERADDLKMEDLIADETTIITVTHAGYIKRCPVGTFRSRHRGGTGVRGMSMKDEDFVEHVFTASTHDYLLIFTKSGQVHWIKAYEVPQMARDAKGKAIVNLLNISNEEKIASMIRIREFDGVRCLMMCTRKGIVKKSALTDYSHPRKGGINAINIDSDDILEDVKITSGHDDVLIVTRNGLSIRFSENDCRKQGRTTRGVRGIRLRKGDYVIGMEIVDDENTSVLVLTEKGFGKRTTFSEWRVQKRGGKGVITIKTNERNGKVISSFTVNETDEIVMVSEGGQLARTRANEFREIGRNTQGVRASRLAEGDKLVCASRVLASESNRTDDKSENNLAEGDNIAAEAEIVSTEVNVENTESVDDMENNDTEK